MKIRKVLLVHSAHHAQDGSVVHARKFLDRFTVANPEKLSLLLIAAYTPKDIVVEKCEDYFQEIPWDTDADVIGIHAQVMQQSRAVEIAGGFRRRGKIVIMGGFLPTMHPELVVEHCDSICIGEGDLVWPQMLKDIEAGTLKKMYKADQPAPLENMPVPRYDLVLKGRPVVYPVQATRGCPFVCDYCSIIQFYDKTYRFRPIPDIIRDIQATRSKNIFFTDDNLMENRAWSKELFKAMEGLGVIWGTQCTINIAKDPELLEAAYKSGCRYVAVGIESISQKNLNGVSKGFNRVDSFAQHIQTIQDHGIAAHALIVFGFPEDTRETFRETVRYLEDCAVAQAEFFIFTPYPKTPAGKQVFDEGRVVDHDINHFRETYVVFKHPKLTPDEIVEGYWETLRSFYSFRSIFSRIWRGSFKMKPLHLIMNLYYWAKVRRGIVPVYFGKGNPVPTERAPA